MAMSLNVRFVRSAEKNAVTFIPPDMVMSSDATCASPSEMRGKNLSAFQNANHDDRKKTNPWQS